MKKNKLFSDFESVSSKAFKQKIQFDLKGADYNDSLVWQSDEGIHVKPFYHLDDAQDYNPIPHHPKEWSIGEELFITTTQKASHQINDVLEQGVEALFLKADAPFDVAEVLSNVPVEIPMYVSLGFLDEAFYLELAQEAAKNKQILYIQTDIVGHLAKEGNWYKNLDGDHKVLNTLLSQGTNNILAVDTTLYQNAGATLVQQLAYGIAHANEYLNHCHISGFSPESITFHLSQGSNYFFEISKIRALRLLFQTVVSAYGFDKVPRCHIVARPSRRNKTIYDYNTNMLRTTTECMSAVLGGANTVVNIPYDEIYHKANPFGQRISRNQLIILKKESYFDAVSNPADGTYYIEELTHQLAEKALAIFKEIEAAGGFLKQLKEGTIQRKINASAAKEQQQFDAQEKVLLGTNKHPNTADRMKDELQLYPFVKKKPRKTLIESIIQRRLAEKIEQERLENEK